MKAVGRFALVRIDEIVTSHGIKVKHDGRGFCISCPEMPELEGLTVIYDTGQTYEEYENHLIMDNKFILAVIE